MRGVWLILLQLDDCGQALRALIAFMGVNASAFVRYFLRGARKTVGNFLLPLLGFVVCFYLWFSLGPKAKLAGLCWLAAGVLYGAGRTNFFTKPLAFAKIESDDDPPAPPSAAKT